MKKTMKTVVAVAAVSAMSVAMFAGCGSSSDSSSASSTSAASESSTAAASTDGSKEYKIAWSHQHMTNAFQNSTTEGADAKAEELGVSITHFDAGQDITQQITDIEQAISDGYDAIIFEPVDPAGTVDVAKKVVDAGIVCINYSSTIDGWEDIVDGYSGASNVEAGEVEMQQVMDLIGGEGEIAILTGPEGDAGGLLRYEGYQNILADYPDVKVVVEAAADWDTTKALETVEPWTSSYPDLKAIVCENDGMAVGAGNAYGDDADIVITGVDASDDGLEAIQNGRQTGTVSQDAKVQGANAVQLAVDILEGVVTGKGNSVTVENIWIDSSNIADYVD